MPLSRRPSGSSARSSVRRLILRAATALTVATVVGVAPSPAGAATARTFANTYAQTLHGDIASIGNANSTCNPAWTPSPSACDTATTPATVNNSSKGFGALVDVDSDPTTTNSSASTVQLPTGSTVRYARLTWGATGDDTDNNGEASVKLDTPQEAGLNYRTVAADYATRCGGLNAAAANRGYACSADVTSEVTAGGSGQYTVGGIEQRAAGTGADSVDHWSGWALYIVFERPGEQLRRIVLSDGFLRVANDATNQPITLSGFTAPANGAVKARLIYATGEGDAGILNDNASLNSTNLDSSNPIDLMNSSNTGHPYQTTRQPSFNNQFGFDLDSQEVDGAIPNGATTATFTFTSTGDTYYPFSTGITINLEEPKVVLTKSLVDVNGGVVESGDVLEYRIVARNQGDDGATDVTLTDNIPANTTYVGGSLQVLTGANAGGKTDATGDDQAFYESGPNRVTMHLGTGATSTAGGALAVGAETTVAFRVLVDPNLPENTPVTNTANGAYKGQTAQFSYANPSTIASTPVRRADMQVAQTVGPLVAGASATVGLVASNTGGASTHGSGVTLSTTVPADVTFGAITSAAGWTCSTASLPAITCTRADALAAGASYPAVEYSVTASQTATGATFTATVAGGNETNTANDTDTDTAPITRSADLRLTNVGSATTARVGDTVTFTIAGRNLGPSNTTGVAVTGTVPSGLDPVSATIGATACAISGQNVSCPVGALTGSGGGADAPSIVVTTTVLPAAAGTTRTFTPSIAGSDPDPVSGNNSAAASVVVEAAADLRLTETVSPGAVNPGAQATFTFTLANVGPGSATGVVLTDDLPAGFVVGSITASQGGCTTGDPFTCNLGTIASGASQTVTIVGRPALSTAGTTLVNPGTVTTTSYDPTTADHAASASLTVNPAADLGTTVTVDALTSDVGETRTYLVSVRNDGPSTAAGATVALDLPNGATVVSVTPSQGTCPASGDPRTCAIGALASGATATVEVKVTLTSANASGAVTLAAEAAATTFDPQTADNAGSASTTVGDAADLQLTQSVAPNPADPGADVTYTFQVRNNGPSTATGVVLTDDLPSGVVVQSITPSKGTCGTGDPFTCQVGTLMNGETATVTVVVRPTLAPAGQTLANAGSLTSATVDPNPSDNTAGTTLTVNPAADLRTTATVDNATATVGATRTYLFTVTNDGPSAAAAVQLPVDLPNGATILAVNPSQGSCPASGDPRSCALGTINAGASATVEVQVRIENANAGAAVTASATASSTTYDPNAANNAASATTNAGNAADLRITKTADRTTANVGDTITWTITVRNDGPDPALGTAVTDAIPTGVTITSATSTVGTCAAGTSATNCTVGTLASGAEAVITIVGRVERAAAGLPAGGQASVTGSVFDPDTSNNVSSATTTVGPAADLRTVVLVDNPNPRPGQTVTWTIQVYNDGPSSAPAVQVTDVVPAGAPITSVATTAGSCTRNGQSVDCALGAIPAGGSQTVTIVATIPTTSAGGPIDNTATATSGVTDPDPANNTSTANGNAAGAADLSITLTPDRDTATVGQRITWNGVVANRGPRTATGVVVTLELPEGLADVAASTPGGTCSVSGRTVTCLVNDVPAGGIGDLTISGIVGRGAAEKNLALSGTAAANELDPSPSDNTTSGRIVAIAPAVDLQLVKTADKPEVAVGDTLTVTGRVTNRGPSTATGVTVVDYLPEGVDLVGVTASQGSCTVDGRKIICNLGVLADGQVATISTVVTVQTAGAGQRLLSGGSVTSDQFDTDASDNTAEVATVGVSGGPAAAPYLELTKTVDNAAPAAGDVIVYTITARNQGNAPATAVRVVDALPAGLGYRGTTVTGGTCSRAARTVTCVSSRLDPGKALVAKISAVVTDPGKPIENVATITAAGLPTTPAKGQLAGVTVKASGAPFVFAAIKAAGGTIRPGSTLRVAVKVTNVGVGTARNARACFRLPSSVVLVRRPAGLTQKGSQFCFTAAALEAGRDKRILLQTRVVGPAGQSRPTITATAANARTRAQAFAFRVQGTRPTRVSGVTG